MRSRRVGKDAIGGRGQGMGIDNAVILSAGRGTRLLPLTLDRPKCLLPLNGRSLLEWQLDTLERAGVRTATVVTGFNAPLVEAVIAARSGPMRVTPLFNPFFHVADNAGSIWIAREAFRGDTLILNGDTLISQAIADRVVSQAIAPISVTTDEKPAYDADDMKVVQLRGTVLRIGKVLPGYAPNAESIGFLALRGAGVGMFLETIEEMMRGPDGTKSWYLKAIDTLAPTGSVATIPIHGLEWAEVDCAEDLPAAQAVTANWARVEANWDMAETVALPRAVAIG
jgi:L-glutamine-phosphate cytidylyltransferase